MFVTLKNLHLQMLVTVVISQKTSDSLFKNKVKHPLFL